MATRTSGKKRSTTKKTSARKTTRRASAARAGAKKTPFFSEEVLRAVRDRPLKAAGMARPKRGTDADDPTVLLTEREYEVLQLVARGLLNREIAEKLELGIKTVETHRMHVMQKLDIHEVASLTRYAIRKGMID